MDVVFAGTAPFGADVLSHLASVVEGRHRIAMVISQPDRPSGRGRRSSPTPVAAVASDLGLTLHQPESINAEAEVERLREADVRVLLVAAYGQILRAPVLEAALPLNVHASLLPRWRGAAPVERALIAGDRETGVCLMRMEAGLDTGPVCGRRTVPIAPEDDAGALFGRLAEQGARLAAAALDRLDDGRTLPFSAQKSEGVTYAHKIVPADRLLDLTRTARQVHDRVRALCPNIGAQAWLRGRPVTVWRTIPPGQAADPDLPTLACGDGELAVAEVQPPGRRRMDAAAWARGLRSRSDGAG
jgi:methionyl-tRNA formyltransferase